MWMGVFAGDDGGGKVEGGVWTREAKNMTWVRSVGE